MFLNRRSRVRSGKVSRAINRLWWSKLKWGQAGKAINKRWWNKLGCGQVGKAINRWWSTDNDEAQWSAFGNNFYSIVKIIMENLFKYMKSRLLYVSSKDWNACCWSIKPSHFCGFFQDCCSTILRCNSFYLQFWRCASLVEFIVSFRAPTLFYRFLTWFSSIFRHTGRSYDAISKGWSFRLRAWEFPPSHVSWTPYHSFCLRFRGWSI